MHYAILFEMHTNIWYYYICIELLYVWGIIFMFITTLIAIFKKEKDCSLEDDHVKLNTFQNYRLLWDICKLPSIKIFAIALLTVKVNNKTKS